MRESKIEAAIVKYAKSRGCLVYKFVSPAHKGVPDRIIVAPGGRVMFMEIKASGETPTPLQMRELFKLRDQGVTATWTDSVEGGKDRVDMLLLK